MNRLIVWAVRLVFVIALVAALVGCSADIKDEEEMQVQLDELTRCVEEGRCAG